MSETTVCSSETNFALQHAELVTHHNAICRVQVAPVGAVVGLDAPRWQYVFAHWQPSGGDELSAAVPAYAATVGAFIGAFPTVSWCNWFVDCHLDLRRYKALIQYLT